MENSKFKKLLFAAALTVISTAGTTHIEAAQIKDETLSPAVYEQLSINENGDSGRLARVIQKQKQQQKQQQKAALASQVELKKDLEDGIIV